MKYRIVTNGYKYRIQYKFNYWPFWNYYKVYMGPYGDSVVKEFSSKEAAQELINEELLTKIKNNNNWRVVND